MLWTTFVVLGCLRLLMPPEPVRFFGQGPFGPGGERGRSRRDLYRPEATPRALPTNVWRISIEVPAEGANRLRGYHWNGWHGADEQERPEVLATVREGGLVYTNVSLRLKGSLGSFRPFDDRPAMTLNFGKGASKQHFHGYPKISLNNSVQDPTYVNEALSRELFEAAGVPAPRADLATVVLNGRELGLYVVTEGWGKPFLKRHFRDVSGNLYEGGFLQEISVDMHVNSGDERENRADLERLIAAASVEDRGERWKRLNEVLDVDRFLSFLAMEVMTCHWDGYSLTRNNYRVFHDRTAGRMVFLPHGMDQMFGSPRSGTGSPIDPPMQGMVAGAVMGTPEGRRLYLERVARLRREVFVEERMTNRVRELAARVRPTLAAYSPEWAADHDRRIEDLMQRIVERCQSISEQLENPRGVVTFSDEGVASLTGWAPRISQRERRGVRFARTSPEEGLVLRIEFARSAGVASWRTRALLEPGGYVFEGRARVQPGAEGGVALRISGARVEPAAAGDGEWVPLRFAWEVDEPMTDVELVCEFSGSGWAEFDGGSLRLRRR